LLRRLELHDTFASGSLTVHEHLGCHDRSDRLEQFDKVIIRRSPWQLDISSALGHAGLHKTHVADVDLLVRLGLVDLHASRAIRSPTVVIGIDIVVEVSSATSTVCSSGESTSSETHSAATESASESTPAKASATTKATSTEAETHTTSHGEPTSTTESWRTEAASSSEASWRVGEAVLEGQQPHYSRSWAAHLSNLEDVAEPVEAVEHFCESACACFNTDDLTNSLSGAFGLDEDNRSVTLGSAIGEEADVRSDNLSGLSHQVLEVLPRSLEGKLWVSDDSVARTSRDTHIGDEDVAVVRVAGTSGAQEVSRFTEGQTDLARDGGGAKSSGLLSVLTVSSDLPCRVRS